MHAQLRAAHGTPVGLDPPAARHRARWYPRGNAAPPRRPARPGRAGARTDERARPRRLLDGRHAAAASAARGRRAGGHARRDRGRAAPRRGAPLPGHAARLGHESLGRRGAAARRRRALVRAHARADRDRRAEPHGDLRARAAERPAAGGRRREGPVLPARSRLAGDLDDRRQRDGVLGRPARAQVRHHARLRDRAGGRAHGRPQCCASAAS